jgi:hypothetical protein
MVGEEAADSDRRRRLVRYAAIAVATPILLWLSLAVSVAGVMREARPDVALMFWPGDGLAEAMQDEYLVQESLSSPRHDTQIALARDAIAAEPTSARAARILAMFSDDQAQVARRFAYARRLSRRDLIINLWFIEEAVQRNDVPGALAQYDVTLRTSSEAPRLLFPILNAAMAQRDLEDPIARLLATGGEWVPDYFEQVLTDRARAPDLGRVTLHRPQVLQRLGAPTQARLIAELADDRQFEIGARLYHIVSGRPAMGFADAAPMTGGDWPPFDWSVTDTGNFGAAGNSGGTSLQVYAQGGSRGTVARRLIRLDPGAYRLSAAGNAGQDDAAGEALWSVNCAQDDSAAVASLSVAGRAPSRQAQHASIHVGPGCAWYWLNLIVASPAEGSRFEATVDRPRIDRLPG